MATFGALARKHNEESKGQPNEDDMKFLNELQEFIMRNYKQISHGRTNAWIIAEGTGRFIELDSKYDIIYPVYKRAQFIRIFDHLVNWLKTQECFFDGFVSTGNANLQFHW